MGEGPGPGPLTFAGLLPALQAVARGAHAGPGALGRGEAELRAVAVIQAAGVGSGCRGEKGGEGQPGAKAPRDEPLPPAQALTLLDALVVHLHVHHQRGAVAQHRHLRPVLLVAGAHPLGGLVSPPQLVACQEKGGSCRSFPHPLPPQQQRAPAPRGFTRDGLEKPFGGEAPPRRLLEVATGSPCSGRAGERALRTAPATPPALTHDGQGGGLAQLTLHGLDHLQVAAVQVAPVDGAVARADPVQFALRVVNGQAWKATDRQRPGVTQGLSPSAGRDGTGRANRVMERTGTRGQGDPAQTSCQPCGLPGLPGLRPKAFRARKGSVGGVVLARGGGSVRTNRPFLVGEEERAVAAVHVGHADVVPVCPVQLPAPVRGR